MDKSLRAIASRWKVSGDDLQVLILQCGDFAWFWPGCNSTGAIHNNVDFLPYGRVPIYWIGGNHEDWDELDRIEEGITEVDPGVFYCPFGTSLQLSPDISVLFAGGAESADKDWRVLHMALGSEKLWWEQEGISEKNIAKLANVPEADWVISHTAPSSFDITAKIHEITGSGRHLYEPSRDMLEIIYKKYNPQKWFFGHFHHYMTGKNHDCDWECLSYPGNGEKYWDKLYLEWATDKPLPNP